MSIEEEIDELHCAGWRKKSASAWVSPEGNLFRGPHGAWEIMRRNAPPEFTRTLVLRDAWRRYVELFGEQPHGTLKQMAALVALEQPAGERPKEDQR